MEKPSAAPSAPPGRTVGGPRDAVVVGSGPNGLAAAITLALAGVRVRVLEAADTAGGGARSAELTVPGLLHDTCSAVHPTGATSPALRPGGSLGLTGLEWAHPEIALAHLLDDGDGAVLYADLAATADVLGADGAAWTGLFGPLAERFDQLAEDVYRPVLHPPRHPALLTRFGAAAATPATALARLWRRPRTRALWAGIAAHAMSSLQIPFSSAAGLLIATAGHRGGWPVAVGGSQAITDALLRRLGELGGVVETGCRVDSLAELDAELVLLDTAPSAALRLLGDRLPGPVARAYRRFRPGPAAYKVDLAVRGRVPWRLPGARRAGTVHVGGSLAEVAAAEGLVARGRLPRKPFVLVAQQYLADPSRSVGELHPVWAYAHVPNGFSGDATNLVLARIEQYAPGFTERVVASHVTGPVDLQRHNANYVGGDIGAGASAGWQLLFRPRFSVNPYATGVPGVHLCSASTPPGPGVHGMCGVRAAEAALAAAS
ncbi:NAD(P)/FAD-dependent oxidoreductase [Naumannella sp. ID2617S]|nr:NAD(P)/FAD-dependent oxidoreductase [Naumannella sp. ID2617S]